MELKEAIEATKIVRDSLKDFPNSYEILDTLLKGAEELQKENEKLKEIDLTTVHIKGVCDEKERWRNKIKEKIVDLKVSQENTENDNLDRKYQYQIDVLEELLKGE